MIEPANTDGNCLPNHHDDTRGGFQRVENYDACESDDEESTDEDEEIALSLNELMYSAHSFHIISLPVSITMVLAALAGMSAFVLFYHVDSYAQDKVSMIWLLRLTCIALFNCLSNPHILTCVTISLSHHKSR